MASPHDPSGRSHHRPPRRGRAGPSVIDGRAGRRDRHYDARMPSCEIVLLVPHPDRPALLTRADDRARLPSTEIDGPFAVPAMLDAIATVLGRSIPGAADRLPPPGRRRRAVARHRGPRDGRRRRAARPRLDGLGVAPHRDARTGRASGRPASLDRPARDRADADRPALGRPGLVRPRVARGCRPHGRARAAGRRTAGARPGLGHLHGAASAVDAGRRLPEVHVAAVPQRADPDGAARGGRPRPGDAGHRDRPPTRAGS